GEMDAGEAEELSAAVDSFDLDDFGEDDDDSSAELSDSLDMDAPAESEEPASEVIEPSSSELSTSINLDAFTTEQPAVGDGETAAEVEENSGDAGGLDEENSLSLDFDATSLPDTDEGETEKSEVNDEIDGLDFESGVSDESTDDDADDAQGETSDPVYEDTEVLDFETDTAPDADAEVDEPEKAIEFDETEILDFETDLDPLESASDDAPAPAEADNASIDDDEGLDATVEFDLDDDLGDGPAATDSVDAEETEELSIEFDAGDSPEVDSDSGDTTAAEQAEEVSAEFDGIELDMDDGEASSVEDSSVGLDETIISFPSDDASEGELDTVQNLDAVASQLDLLAAYVDMDDRDQAAALNEKIQAHGNDEQKQQAEELMKQLSS
ncbi:MAG: FimV/HubP family polar landmark protein, partial [Gammaproteobacteria bacterium]